MLLVVLVLLPIVPWVLSFNEGLWCIFVIEDWRFCGYTDSEGAIADLSCSQCDV